MSLIIKLSIMAMLIFGISADIDPNDKGQCVFYNLSIRDENYYFEQTTKCSALKFNYGYFQVFPKLLLVLNPKATMVSFYDSSIDMMSFQNVTNSVNVKDISFVNVVIQKIPKDAFNKVSNVKIITFINVNITNIEGKPLDELKKLRFLNIYKSNVKNYQNILSFNRKIDGFKCVSCSLNDEVLENLFKKLNVNLSVDFSQNEIENFNCSFNPKSLIITSNELIGTFDSCHITDISVRNNKLTGLFIQKSAVAIDATNNFISEIKCGSDLAVEEFSIDNNKLSNFQCISSMFSLKLLNINSNEFQNFIPEWFENLKNLEVISLMENQLVNYDPIMFMASRNNRIVQIKIEKFNYGYEVLKHFYPNLREIIHDKLRIDCDEYFEISDDLLKQKIALTYLDTVNCSYLISVNTS